MNANTTGILQTISGEIQQLAETTGRSVVSVNSHGRAGSGVVWDGKTVVTAYHVVKGLDQATIGTEDGRKLTAKVLGRIPHSDIAALEVETGLPPLTRGESSNLKVGQFVLALANPFASHTSVTSGIVTSVNRTVGGWWGLTIENAVITDARVNPGYSGGPLVDASGRLIGINVAYFSGRSISIPVDSISRAVTRLTSGQPFKKAYLGIYSSPVELPKEVSSESDTKQESGLMVLSVEDGAPAKAAGLTLGDVILKFNGTETSNPSDLTTLLKEDAIGRPAKLVVLRGGKVDEMTVTPTEKEE